MGAGSAGKMIEKLIAFFEGMRIPMKLSALGIDETHFEAMARHCQKNTFEGFVPLDWEDNMRI